MSLYDASNKSVIAGPITAMPAHGLVSGLKVSMVAGEALSFGDVCYLNSSNGKLYKANANAAGTMTAFAIATAAISADASGEFLLFGTITNSSWTWMTSGAPLFVTTSAGLLSQSAPSTSGYIVQIAGRVINADTILFAPSHDYIVIA